MTTKRTAKKKAAATKTTVKRRPSYIEWQDRFIAEYCIDLNGTQAAIRAGYSPNGADVTAVRLLAQTRIRTEIDKRLAAIAKATETDAQWVRRRLKEEAEDFSEFASHSARVRAIELVAKLNGLFAEDNKQKGGELAALLARLDGNVWVPIEGAPGLAIEMGDDD